MYPYRFNFILITTLALALCVVSAPAVAGWPKWCSLFFLRNATHATPQIDLSSPGTSIRTEQPMSRGGIEGSIVRNNKSGETIAALSYAIFSDGTTAFIDDVHVYEEELRGKGLSKLLFNELTVAHPQVRTIKSTLNGTNEQIYRQALAQGHEPAAAVRLTPYYKTLSSLGFTKLTLEPVGTHGEIPITLSR